MLERKKLKSWNHGVPESLSHGVFFSYIEELTFLISFEKKHVCTNPAKFMMATLKPRIRIRHILLSGSSS